MDVSLSGHSYGKAGIRLSRIVRDGGRHSFTDVTVDTRLEGDFAAAYLDGDNRGVLPTDTMRGTVYAFAREQPVGEIEEFGLRLAARFLDATPAATAAEIALREHPWQRLPADGGGHPFAFTRVLAGTRTARVRRTRDEAAVTAGVADLPVLKTTGSAFGGFLVDDYTTLPETSDRIMATEITADWDYAGADVDYRAAAADVRATLLATFADHDSASVQHTLYAMGEAVLARRPEIAEIRLRMPNQHHLLADLSPYGLDNPNEVFVVSDRPYGVIEGTVTRD